MFYKKNVKFTHILCGFGYALWLFALFGLSMGVFYRIIKGPIVLSINPKSELWKALGGGVASMLSYGAVIWAMQRAEMGMVSALRETSVLFALLIGRLFLHERLKPQQLIACCIICTGTILIAIHL